MESETLKLELINRLINVSEYSTLKRMEQLISQAEMESRTLDSLEAIQNGEILSIDTFEQENKKWLKKNYTK